MRQIAIFLGATLFVVSCVPKKKFNTLLSERNAIQSKLTSTESKLTETKGELVKVTEDAKALEGKVGNLTQSLETEKGKVEALSANLAQTSDQLSQVSTRQARVQDQYAKLHQILADKEKYKTVADARVAEYWSLRSKLGVTSYPGKAQAAIEDGRLLVALPVDSIFVGNTANLTPSGVTTIQEAARALATLESQPRFVVETYTDSSSPAGSGHSTNWELGAARALAITQVMTVRKGGPLAQNRVGAQTFGDSNPRTLNENAEGRALNRRAYIVVLPNNAQIPGFAELKSASDAVSTVKFDAQGRAVVSTDATVTAPAAPTAPPVEAAPSATPPLVPEASAPVPLPPPVAAPAPLPPPVEAPAPLPPVAAPAPLPPATVVDTAAPKDMIPARPAPPPAPVKQVAVPGKAPRIPRVVKAPPTKAPAKK